MDRQEDGNFIRNLGKLDENKYLVYAFNNGVQENTCAAKEVKSAEIGQTVEADVTAPTGFTFNDKAVDSKVSGNVAEDGSKTKAKFKITITK